MPRKVICSIATSADGYIARTDGSFDWLMKHAGTPDKYGMNEFMASIDTILWGRTTWDQVQAMTDAGEVPPMDENARNYVFTTRPDSVRRTHGAHIVTEPIAPFMQRLRAEPGKDIWMMGGGGLIASFLEAGELDEMIVAVVPVYIGAGIPLIAPREMEIPLELVSTKAYDDGVVVLHHAILRQSGE